ncbi:hypothetical protein [Neobacillus sp. SuZ13]|uniref:hypothetical protein n=1 Tax=Neobacillus sp. SuZ13 TaxID=3047875 RepID=UPI0024C0772B|nr:hypothetical protein [Neobacillus sp. SuZ13]WHY64905.1 hypothetical protein QNH17_17485 [Neobacillus sp. SuZ13]
MEIHWKEVHVYMNQNYSIDPNQIPKFTSHEEARAWFKGQYGDRFLLRMTDLKDGRRVNFYHLVKDPEVYKPYMESFASVVPHEITNINTFKSYTTIEIDENGQVDIKD